MLIWSQTAAIAFLATAAIVPAVRHWALHKGLTDVPNERSSHRIPKPRIGGIGIILGTSIGVAVTLSSNTWVASAEGLSLVLILLALGGVGGIDDIKPLSAAVRLPLYLAGALLIALFCYHAESLTVPGLGVVVLGSAGGILFSALFLAWYTNLFNFMDGIDGIAASAGSIACGGLAYIFAMHGDQFLAHLALAVAAASLGFLLYNYAPSSVFMGDIGSVFLGATCGALSLAAVSKGYASISACVLLAFPFVFDATFTLCSRAVRGQKVWVAHRTHIYQRLCDLGLSHRTVTILYLVAAVFCAQLGLTFDHLSPWGQAIIFPILLTVCVVGATMVNIKHKAFDEAKVLPPIVDG